MKNKILIICIAVISTIMMTSCGSNQGKDTVSDSQYPIADLTRQSIVLEQVFPATIKGQEDIEIRPRIDGFIEEIYIDEGSIVKKGQALFKIDSPDADANLISAQANLKTAMLDVERIEPLAEKKIISEVQLKSSRNRLEIAEATLKQAQAAVSWTRVTSPVDGVAGHISFRKGSLVNSSVILTTIANTNNVFVYFSMNEKELMEMLNNLQGETQAEKIKNIPDISLRLADGTVYSEKGKIETIAGLVDITTGSASFRAVFPNTKGLLRSGTSGNVIIPRTIEDIFIIPQKATFSIQDKRQVYVVKNENAVMKTISVISTSDGQSFIVTEGLNESDIIITDGIATLRNGMSVKTK